MGTKTYFANVLEQLARGQEAVARETLLLAIAEAWLRMREGDVGRTAGEIVWRTELLDHLADCVFV